MFHYFLCVGRSGTRTSRYQMPVCNANYSTITSANYPRQKDVYISNIKMLHFLVLFSEGEAFYMLIQAKSYLCSIYQTNYLSQSWFPHSDIYSFVTFHVKQYFKWNLISYVAALYVLQKYFIQECVKLIFILCMYVFRQYLC